MKLVRCLILILATAALLAGAGCAAEGVPDDAEIQARIEAAWDEIREYAAFGKEEEKDPQPRLAGELYAVWVEQPEREAAQRAMENAFMMWGNVGALDEIEDALARLDPSSKSWGAILTSVGNAYARNERYDDFEAICLELEDKLTDPKSRSELITHLAQIARDDPQKARTYYEQILELDADPFYSNKARGEIYELDSLNPGQAAPEFRAESIDGTSIALSELTGRIVVLEFWATWCGPCLPEVEHLKKIREKHSDEEVFVLGISLDRELEPLREYVEKEDISWPQLLRVEGWDDEISKLYNVSGIPRAYLIDAEGVIVAKDLRGEELEAAVEQLAEAPAPP